MDDFTAAENNDDMTGWMILSPRLFELMKQLGKRILDKKLICWSYFKAFSMGTQVNSPGTKAPDKEKVQEILKVSQFFSLVPLLRDQIFHWRFTFEGSDEVN